MPSGMKMEHDLTALRAETLAVQAILTSVLFELKMLDPTLAEAIGRGFDNAANQIEGSGIGSAKLIKALGLIEDLRTATLHRP